MTELDQIEIELLVEEIHRRFPQAVVRLSATYYTGMVDTVSHVPDRCVTADGFREMARRCAALAPRVAAVLEGGYNLRTLPTLVGAAKEGFEAA